MHVVAHRVAPCIQAWLLLAGLVLAWPAPANAERVSQAEYFATVVDMMTELAPQSAQAGLMIRDTYRPYLEFLFLSGYAHILDALGNGGLVPLPDPHRFNLIPRLEGTSPIDEKDLGNQSTYLSARPAAFGCLLLIASRVRSGPVEVTSLVRHGQYQDALRTTNANATTDVPMHTMGLAFDIAIVNTPLETVLEIRDVLQQMQDAGEILFVAEQHQLVFHVVPHPTRLGYFSDVYAGALETGLPFGLEFDSTLRLMPSVTAETITLAPAPGFEMEWWAAENVPVDVAIEVTAAAPLPDGYLERLGDFIASTVRMFGFGYSRA